MNFPNPTALFRMVGRMVTDSSEGLASRQTLQHWAVSYLSYNSYERISVEDSIAFGHSCEPQI